MNLLSKIANNIKIRRAKKELSKVRNIQDLMHSGSTGFNKDSRALIMGYLDSKEEEFTSELVTLLFKNQGIDLTYAEPIPMDETQHNVVGS